MSLPYDIDQSIRDNLKEKYNQNGMSCVEEIVQHLRTHGISQMPTVFFLVSELGLPFSQANDYVCKCWNE